MTETKSALVTISKTVEISGETIAIKPLVTEHVLMLVDALFAIYKTVLESGGTLALTSLASALPDVVFRILAVTTGKPEAFYRQADPIEFLDVVEAWWEVNGDFFVQRLVPRLQKMVAQLTPKASQ